MTTDGVVTLRFDGDGVTVEADGRAIGTGEVRDIGESTAEISVALDPAYRGLGYATRAVRLLVEYAFGELGFGRVQARVATDNAAAVRVARRAGSRPGPAPRRRCPARRGSAPRRNAGSSRRRRPPC